MRRLDGLALLNRFAWIFQAIPIRCGMPEHLRVHGEHCQSNDARLSALRRPASSLMVKKLGTPAHGLCLVCQRLGQGAGVGWPGPVAELLAQVPVFA